MTNEIKGFVYSLVAFSIWGFAPLFWRLNRQFDSFDLLSHRILWSLLFVSIYLILKPPIETKLTLKQGGLLVLSGAFLFVNWYLFVLSVHLNQVTSASLGYYLNPLFNLFFGLFLLKEKAKPLLIWAFAIAGFGVMTALVSQSNLNLTIAFGLGSTFAVYGLIRKRIGLESALGLWYEMILGLPVAGYLIWQSLVQGADSSYFVLWNNPTPGLIFFFIGTGLLTIVPLYFFNAAVLHLSYISIGALQYVAPSLQLFVGVILLKEGFDASKGVLFVCVWISVSLTLYSMIKTRLEVSR